jgi:hypothetical protein
MDIRDELAEIIRFQTSIERRAAEIIADAILARFHVAERKPVSPPECKCPTCHGRGRLLIIGTTSGRVDKCPRCAGTGKLAA